MTEQPDPAIAAIARWSGVALPNAAAERALRDLAGMIADYERHRDGMAFEMEPAQFDQALRDCREPRT